MGMAQSYSSHISGTLPLPLVSLTLHHILYFIVAAYRYRLCVCVCVWVFKLLKLPDISCHIPLHCGFQGYISLELSSGVNINTRITHKCYLCR